MRTLTVCHSYAIRTKNIIHQIPQSNKLKSFFYSFFTKRNQFFLMLVVVSILTAFSKIDAQTTSAVPCNAHRWEGGDGWRLINNVWTIESNPNDLPKGIVRCASSAEEESQLQDYKHPYDPSAFTIVSQCFASPLAGNDVVWLNFDVRPYAGSFQYQLGTGGSSDEDLAWALYYSDAFTPGLGADGLSGNCSSLISTNCGVVENGWLTLTVPKFPKPTNYYIAIWSTSSGGLDKNINFKARYGCGETPITCSFEKSGDPSLTCNGNGTYTVCQDFVGANGQWTIKDNAGTKAKSYDVKTFKLDNTQVDHFTSTDLSSTPISFILTNLGSDGAVKATVCATYATGIDYNIQLLASGLPNPPAGYTGCTTGSSFSGTGLTSATPEKPAATIEQPDCFNPNGKVTITGAVDGVIYTLSDGETDYTADGNGVFNDIPPGQYTFTASSEGVCDYVGDNITIFDPPTTLGDPPSATVNHPTCTNDKGSVQVDDPIDGVTYTLSKNGSVVYTADEDGLFSDVAPGTYILTASNGDCSSSGIADVVVNDPPASPTVTADNKSVCTGSSVTLTGTPANGTWSGAHVTGSSFDATGLAAGPYTVTYSYTNDDGCSGSKDATITVNSLPSVTADNKSVCTGSSVTLTGTPANGTWSGDHVTGSSFDATGLAAGPYTVTYSYTDGNGCSNSKDATVTVNSLPTVTADNKSVCTGSNVTLTGTPANGTWSGAHVTGTSFDATGLAAGPYTVTYSYTDGNGCSNSKDATVTVNSLPTVTADNKSLCSGSTVALTGTPANGTWSGDHVTGSTFDATGLAAGPYTVTYSFTDGNGCSNSKDATITVKALPTVSAGSNVSICNGGSTTLTASGAVTYVWSPATGLSATTGSSVTANPTSTTTYTVSGTAANYCTNTAQVTVTVNPVPACDISNTTSSGSHTAGVGVPISFTGPSAPGGSTYGYQWSFTTNTSGATFTGGVITATTQSVTVTTLNTGSYTLSLKVTDKTYSTNCNRTCTYSMTINNSNAYYTATQGFYGNLGGKICTPSGTLYTSGNKGNVDGIINVCILAMPGQQLKLGTLPVTVTATSKTFIMGSTSAEERNLIQYLPAGQTATVILANSGSNNNTNMTSNLPKIYNKKISNILLGQSITLALNIYIPNNNLKDFVLKTGYLTTQKADLSTCPVTKVLPCSKDASTYSSLEITTNAGLKAWINASTRTVKDLLDLASNALGGSDIATLTGQSGITLSDISNAVDVINRSFDGGRVFINYYSSAKSCSVLPTITKATNAETETINISSLSVSTYPNPFNDKVRFVIQSPVSGKASLEVFTMLGQKVKTVFNGHVFAGIPQPVEYTVPNASRVNLIYVLRVNDKQVTGKLINGQQ